MKNLLQAGWSKSSRSNAENTLNMFFRRFFFKRFLIWRLLIKDSKSRSEVIAFLSILTGSPYEIWHKPLISHDITWLLWKLSHNTWPLSHDSFTKSPILNRWKWLNMFQYTRENFWKVLRAYFFNNFENKFNGNFDWVLDGEVFELRPRVSRTISIWPLKNSPRSLPIRRNYWYRNSISSRILCSCLFVIVIQFLDFSAPVRSSLFDWPWGNTLRIDHQGPFFVFEGNSN